MKRKSVGVDLRRLCDRAALARRDARCFTTKLRHTASTCLSFDVDAAGVFRVRTSNVHLPARKAHIGGDHVVNVSTGIAHMYVPIDDCFSAYGDDDIAHCVSDYE